MSQPGNTHEPRVYFIEAPSVGLIKIGWTTNLESRLVGIRVSELNGAIHGDALRVLGWVAGDCADEHMLHKHFAVFHVRGEWFDAEAARPYIEDILALTAEQVAAWFAWHRRKAEKSAETIERQERHLAYVAARRRRNQRKAA